jgi:hypothetical protein
MFRPYMFNRPSSGQRTRKSIVNFYLDYHLLILPLRKNHHIYSSTLISTIIPYPHTSTLSYRPVSLCRLLLQHFNIFCRISSIYNIDKKWQPFWKYPWKLPPYIAIYRPRNDYGAPHEWIQLTQYIGKSCPLTK